MLGALALVVCLAGAGGVGWILYHLYAPKLPAEVTRRLPGRLIVEPMFAAKPKPSAPRTRLARGTGGVPNKQLPGHAETTEKVTRRASP